MLIRAVFLAGAAAAAALLLTACGNGGGGGGGSNAPAVKFNATDITGAAFGKTLALNDAATQQPRTLASYQGKATVLFFGYMFCPDFCPTTMSTLNTALGKMKPADAAKVQVIFVTVDPKRDQPKLLSDYVHAFNPTFAALYGSDEQTAIVAKEFKIIYQKAQVKSDTTYLMDHSTQMYVFDPQGKIRLLVRHESGADAIAADLTMLVKS